MAELSKIKINGISYDIKDAVARSSIPTDISDLTDTNRIIPTVPETVSSFQNDAGYLTSFTETDPTVPSWAK